MSWILDHQQLHITIGSIPQIRAEGGYDLKNDLQLIKASILYADHAKLCSFSSASILSLLVPTEIPENKRLDFLKEMRTWPIVDQETRGKIDGVVEAYEFANRRRHSKRGKLLLKQIRDQLGENWLSAHESMRSIISDMGGDGIVQAVGSELLEVYTFGSILKGTDSQAVIDEYVRVLSAAVSDAKTYPLFDESAGRLISSGIAAGIIPVSDSGIDRGKEVALAADLFARLPLFPKATVNEILDIRRELERPLRRFRSAMITYSQKIQEASWDDDFTASAETLFRQEVEPSILTIEEQVNSNRFLNELTSRLVPVGAAAISTLVVSMTNLPSAAIVALSAIGATIGVATATQAYVQWAKDKQMTEQNHLYFYYKAGQFLADGTYEYVSDRVE